MRIPPFERYVKGMQMFGVLLLGMLIGAIVFNSLYHSQVELLIIRNSELKVKIAQLEGDLQKFQQFKNQHTVIKSVLPRIEQEAGQNTTRPNIDKVTEAELIKRIKADLSSFIGQSIYEIDSDAQLARKLLERKVYTDVYSKDYSIEIKTVLVVENVLRVWVTVRSYTKPPG